MIKFKKILSLVLVFVLLASVCTNGPMPVFAVGSEPILTAVPADVTPTEESLGTQVAYVANDTVTVYEYYENGALGMVCTGALGEQIELTKKFTYTVDGVDTVIYHFADSDFAGAMGAADDANYQFILASDVTFTAPEVTPDPEPDETVIPNSVTGVSVAGDLPDDVTLTVTEKTLAESGIDTSVYPISGASLFYDVTLLQNSAEYQPENAITVTFPEAAITNSGLAVGDYYKVYHIHDGVTDVTGPFEYTGGAIDATFYSLSVVGLAETETGIKVTDVYGDFVSEESYTGYAVINSDTIRVYGAADTGTTDYYELTGVKGIALELISPKATYANGVLYHFVYNGTDETIKTVNYYFIPEEFITLTCCANCTGAVGCTCGCENCTCAEEEADKTPTVGTRTTTVNGVTITVEGSMLSEATLSASVYTVTNPGAFGLADTSSIKAAYDIKLLDADGNAIQPDGNVFVTMDVATMGFSNGDVVEVIHQHGSTIETSTHVVISGKLIFPVDGFSVFVVNSTTETTGAEITGNSSDNPYVMTVGESKIFFDSYGGGTSPYTAVTNTSVRQMYNSNTTYYYLVDGVYKEVNITREGSRGNYTYTISYADGSGDIETNLQGNNQPSRTYYYQASGSTAYRGEWQVTDESNAISYEITSVDYNGDNDWQHMAPYIEVKAKDVGLVTLTYKYVSGGSIYEETLYVSVVAPNAELYVDDQVAENGCLVPAGLEDVEDVTYTWTRSDGQVIQSEALNADGTVNVSLDRGGLTGSRDPITYTVTATLANGTTTYTASYEVLYSNEILNPSFENTPVEDGLTNQYFYNGYPGLYWKTTTPGSSTSQLTQDIEIITENGDPAGSYGSNVTQASHGEQFAEVNAEGFGALYQDILTTPGATLNWSFAHMARTSPSDSENTMYVVVAATEYAQSIIDFDDIDGLLDAARGSSIPSSGTGASFTYNGGTYYIWKHDGTNNWETISGSYVVPNDQYLTRLFFVSETANAASVNETCGNLIDAVSAGETMSYKIEYYVDGSLVSANTQSGSATVYTSVDLAHLDNYIADGYVLTSAKIQLETGNVDYPGNVNNGLYITAYGDSGDDDYAIILKVYLAKRAVTITKKIVIDGWADMTDEEKIALIGSGLTAEFALTSDSKTYTAKLTIIAVSANGELTAMGEFLDSNGEAPDNGNYTVTETSAPIIGGYSCSTTFDKTNITVSDTEPTASIVCTNTYEQSAGTLVIEKTVTKAYENDTLPNDTFTFTVSGVTDGTYDVVVDGVSGTATASGGTLTVSLSGFTVGEKKTISISELPAGEYTVTEIADDDYTTTGPDGSITVAAGKTSTASFTNEYKRHLVDLTIKKTGWNSTDENQSFIFDVVGPNDFKITVTINGNGEVTIKDLPIGEYTVTEQTDWSWRYTPDAETQKITLVANRENEVTFANNRSWIYWLSGDSFCTNWWGGENGTVTKRKASN